MALSVNQIQNASNDDALYGLLQAELLRLFPMWLLEKPASFRRRREAAPPGMRAMAATYDLDVSLALDDLSWHFLNHPGLWENEETLWALGELEWPDAASLYGHALEFMRPRLGALVAKTMEWNKRPDTERESHGKIVHDASFMHDWLDESGVSTVLDPLTDKFWKLIKPAPLGVFTWWLAYARKHPDRCVGGKPPVFWNRFSR